MKDLLSHFTFAQFQFFLKILDRVDLPPYKGSTFRGGFGHVFKKVVCINRNNVCGSCLLKDKCIYSYVFETPPPPDTSKMRKYPYAPHPFVIIPPLEDKERYQEGNTLDFELTLIGKAIDYLPYFIYTFDELGRVGIGKGKGNFQLEEVRSQVNQNEEKTIYSSKEKKLHQFFKVIKGEDLIQSYPSHLTFDSLTFNFITPTRLKFDGKLSSELEFHILIRNLLRRISLLSYFHCGEELNLGFKGLIDKAKEVKVKTSNLSWLDWERYSNRQETRMKLGGFTGPITFEGEFETFLPFLLLGEYIHVGKGTSFGLGKYQIMGN